MTTFVLEITQVQLKNHTKSHESKLRISDPEWYGIYVQMSGPQCRCCRRHLCVTCRHRRPCVTRHCCRHRTRVAVVAHASLATAVVVAHASPSLPMCHLPLPSSSHMHRRRRHCCRCRLQVLVGGSPLSSLSLSLSSLLLLALPLSPYGVILLSPKCVYLGLKQHTT